MRPRLIVALVVIALVAGAVWLKFRRPPAPYGFDRTQNVLPAETRQVLETGSKFILLSLDPMPPTRQQEPAPPGQELFHDYVVRGKTEISDKKKRAELLSALYAGIADSDGLVYNCFNPRHGISVTLDDATVDLVICFECQYIQTYAKAGKSVLTTRSPESAFNRALSDARLPVATGR